MLALALRYGPAALAGAVVGWALTFAYVEAVSLPAAREAGRQAERSAALSRSMDIIRKRNRTDEEINALDRAELCKRLGGQWVPNGEPGCR